MQVTSVPRACQPMPILACTNHCSKQALTRLPTARCAASESTGEQPKPGANIELDADSEMARKKAAADELRAQEKFMMIGTGEAQCKGCGYTYDPKLGDPEYPIAKGIKFEELPEDWLCPVCGAEKRLFESKAKEVAGFAANQGYGLGTNSMTGDQKSLLIYGSLLFFFALFLLGYTLE